MALRPGYCSYALMTAYTRYCTILYKPSYLCQFSTLHSEVNKCTFSNMLNKCTFSNVLNKRWVSQNSRTFSNNNTMVQHRGTFSNNNTMVQHKDKIIEKEPTNPSEKPQDSVKCLETNVHLANTHLANHGSLEANELQNSLTKLINEHFPPSELCFAYGSKILLQNNHTATEGTMTDIIFVVKDSDKWHVENRKKNPKHYSLLLRVLGQDVIEFLQSSVKPYCYFHPYIKIEGTLIKYGVIPEDKLYRDLEYWDTLYIAGRLHKPVLYLHISPTFDTYLLDLNLRSALYTALILLPEKFNDLQLFHMISSLSYRGDIRNVLKLEVAVYKVMNMVKPNIQHFKYLYKDQIEQSPFITVTDYGYCQKNKSAKNIEILHKLVPSILFKFPEGKLRPLSRFMRFNPYVDAKTQVIRKVGVGDVRYIQGNVEDVVRKSSMRQLVKGFFTAGPIKSVRYALAKFLKKFKKTKTTNHSSASLSHDTKQPITAQHSTKTIENED